MRLAARPRRSKIARALELWAQGEPIAGTLAERYLAETRRIDVAGLPANISDSLRFLARCPFGPGTLTALPARAHARPGERPTDRDPAHRA